MSKATRGSWQRGGVALVGALLALACGQAHAAEAPAAGRDGQPAALRLEAASAPLDRAFVPREVIVRFEPGAGELRERARRAVGARDSEPLLLPRTQVVELPRGTTVREAVRELEGRPGVAWAEPNYLFRIQATPNDPEFWRLWGLQNTGQDFAEGYVPAGRPGADIDATRAWDHATGSDKALVAVVDSGVAIGHPDLKGNVWRNPGEVLDGEDNDGNGLVDDVNGWDFVDEDPVLADPDGHGTHVAGTIAARGNNGHGIAGVAWRAGIMPLRVADEFGYGSTSAIVDAFAYAGDHGADVVNLSMGAPASAYDDEEVQALSDVVAAYPETLFVVAAGNDGSDNDAEPVLPCNLANENLICVAASDANDELAPFSNWGAESVDLAAPGRTIYSTLSVRYLLDTGTLLGVETFQREVFSTPPQWTHGVLTPGSPDSWGRFEWRPGDWALADSPGADYEPSTDSYAASPAFSLAGRRGCVLRYMAEIDMDADPPASPEAYFEQGDIALIELAFSAPDSGDSAWLADYGKFPPAEYYVRIPDEFVEGRDVTYLRFGLWSDSNDIVDEGFWVDNAAVTCRENTFGYFSGTSMAAPHASGVVALLRSWLPDARAAELRAALLGGTDKLPGLAGKVASGGRLNAYGALRELDRIGLTTEITKAPRKRVTTRKRKATVTYAFRARAAGARFECKLDNRRWRPCSRRVSFKVGAGRHTLRVRATRGLAPGPVAAHKFTVKRKRKRR